MLQKSDLAFSFKSTILEGADKCWLTGHAQDGGFATVTAIDSGSNTLNILAATANSRSQQDKPTSGLLTNTSLRAPSHKELLSFVLTREGALTLSGCPVL